MKKRVQGDTFITHCTVSYKLFISQTSTKHPTKLPGSSFLSPFPIFLSLLFCFCSSPAAAECRERGGGAHQEHPVGAVPGHGHQRAALRLGRCGIPWEQPRAGLQHLTAGECKPQGSDPDSGSCTATLHLALFWGDINKLANNAVYSPASDKYCISCLRLDKYCVSYLEQQLPPSVDVPAHGKGLEVNGF